MELPEKDLIRIRIKRWTVVQKLCFGMRPLRHRTCSLAVPKSTDDLSMDTFPPGSTALCRERAQLHR